MNQKAIDSTDRELKATHRAVWALGDYPAVATEIIPELGRVVVEASRLRPGDNVLDVAAGSGNAAIPAALAGAKVIASDLTPELLDIGRKHAAESGATLEWVEADAEALPFGDGQFDSVLSSVGVMFAPHHQATADELVRVVRRGGTIGLINWTPDGFIGQMFATMKPYLPPAPAGVQPPPLWGNDEYVRGLFGNRVTDIVSERRNLAVDHFATPDAFRNYFKANYGPTVAAFRSLAGAPDQVIALDRELTELAERFQSAGSTMNWEYLLFTARKV